MAVPIGTIAAIAGPPILSAIFEGLGGNRIKKLQEEVLMEQKEFADRLNRISRGEFTTAERMAIEKANEPTLNAISGSLARRGIRRSPASAQVIAAARQAPFVRTQSAALGAAPGALESVQRTASLFEQPAFAETLGGITRDFFILKGLNQIDDDPLLKSGVEALYNGAIIDPAQGSAVSEVV